MLQYKSRQCVSQNRIINDSMNRFHGIQQDRESLYVPSFSDDAASASSYEGDADDDSFETAGHLSHNKKLPDFGQDSITRSRAKRQKISRPAIIRSFRKGL